MTLSQVEIEASENLAEWTLDIPVPPERKPPSDLRRLLGRTNHIPKVQVAALSLKVAARRFSI